MLSTPRLQAMKRLRNRYFLVSDLVLLPVAAFLAFSLRLEGFSLGAYWQCFVFFAVVVVALAPPVLWLAGIYSRYWRYASVEEVLLLAGAVVAIDLLASGIGVFLFPLVPGLLPLPRSIPFMFFFLALTAIAVPRYLVRLTARSSYRVRIEGGSGDQELESPKPVIIIGAGDAGAMMVRELKSNPQLGLDPVGFLDDDLGKHDVLIHGIPVLGDRYAIHDAAKRLHAEQVIIAMPTASGRTIREIVAICEEAGVAARIVPGMYELLGGQVTVSQLRPVQIEDLLRREPVKTDTARVAALVRGRRVLVTGAGGTVGSELVRQVSRYEPSEVVLLGHGENSVFDISNELIWQGQRGRDRLPAAVAKVAYHAVIADIRDADRLRAVFSRLRPEIVFHAAAHKHVPLMETNVEEAVANNVHGTRTLVNASLAAGVHRFVFISTDKAVNPTSVMGASKRVAEMIVQQAAIASKHPYVAVRFGNVLGSRGSIVPIWQKQIAAGGPVTVTHPDARRYFMTVPEAVQLVLQAAALGKGGEVFILDMGEPVRIMDLANDVIRLSGLEPGHDIDVVFTGLRPGDKLFEQLFAEEEAYTRTQHEKIFVCRNGAGAGAPKGVTLNAALDDLIAAARRGDTDEARRRLACLVPSFQEAPDAPLADLDSLPAE